MGIWSRRLRQAIPMARRLGREIPRRSRRGRGLAGRQGDLYDAAALATLGTAPCGQSSSVNVNSEVRFTGSSTAEQVSTITENRAVVKLTAVPC